MVLDCFEYALVINSDSEVGRLRRITDRLTAVRIPFERFPAIVPTERRRHFSVGELGCTLSHRGAVYLAMERNYESVLIFEDDVIFREDFQTRWAGLAAQVKELPFDIFYFYDWQGSNQSGATQVVQIEGSLCLHAYAVRAHFYQTFLDFLDQAERSATACDQVLKRALCRKWATVPNLIGQDEGISTTYHARRRLRWSANDG